MHVLFETASGYSLFEANQVEDIGKNLDEVQQDILDLAKFGKRLTLVSFLPFKSAAHALENINAIAEGTVHASLKSFLEMNLAKTGKKSKVVLGISDKALATSIMQDTGIECVSNDVVSEITRGLRLHFEKMLKELSPGDLEKAQLGLGHSYSRSKVAFNVNRSDNMIIQAIAVCDQLDKDINLFSMRIREWYSWHFPELARIVSEHGLYAKLAAFIRNRSTLTADSIEPLTEIVQDSNKAQQIFDASRTSMGTDISEIDMINIDHFAKKLIDLTDYRKELGGYLSDKMNIVAPNLAALIGDSVGARLISHAGSLTNLAKFPASTVQILGAEKALFRALKTRGKTPKYGLIFHSSFIGRAGTKNKGRISRYLANKCSIASRIDSFSDAPNTAYGDAMRKQVEDRLEFFESGVAPAGNEAVMQGVLASLQHQNDTVSSKKRKSTKTEAEAEVAPVKKSKKETKSKVPEVEKKMDDKKVDKKKEKSSASKKESSDLEKPEKEKKEKKEEKEKKEKKGKKEEKEEKEEKSTDKKKDKKKKSG